MSAGLKRVYFNGIAAGWDSMTARAEAPAKVRRFVEKALASRPQRVLDAGCGTGVLLPSLLESLSSAALVAETDFAESMLRENAGKTADPRVRWICADAALLPARDQSFDLVLCFGLLPHLEERDAALAELLRVLRPGGALCVGHLMASGELNEFHRSLSGPVSGDSLPPATEVAATLSRLGARTTDSEEAPGWYFVRVERCAV